MTADDLAARISHAYAEHLSRGARPQRAHDHVWASQYRKCDRRIVLDCEQPEALPPWTAEQLARFRRGDDRERDLMIDLARVGRESDPPFTVVNHQEHFTVRGRRHAVVLTGKIDGRIEIDGARPVIEVKAWAPHTVGRIERFADVLDNPWTESGGYQTLAYLYGMSEPYGFLVLDRSGLPKLIPVVLDENLDRMEAFLSKAESALDHVKAGTLPGYIEDPAECRRCPWYGAVCNPPLVATGAAVLTDPELEAALDRREALQAAADEYDDLDKDIKGRLRGVEAAVIGPYAISGKWGKSSRVVMPDVVRRLYTVSDPRGRFTLEITRLGGAA